MSNLSFSLKQSFKTLFDKSLSQPCCWPIVLLVLGIVLPKEVISKSDIELKDSRLSKRKFHTWHDLIILLLIRSGILSLQSIFPFSLLYVLRYLQVRLNSYMYGQRLNPLSIEPAYLTSRIHSKFNLHSIKLLKILNGCSHFLFFYTFIECYFFIWTYLKSKKLQQRTISPPISSNQKSLFIDRCLSASFIANDEWSSEHQINELENYKSKTNEYKVNNDEKLNQEIPTIQSIDNNNNNNNSQSTVDKISLSFWDAREFFRGWFFNVPYELIYEDNIKQYIAFGLFSRDLNELKPEEISEIKIIFRILMSGAVDKIRMSIQRRKNHINKLKLNNQYKQNQLIQSNNTSDTPILPSNHQLLRDDSIESNRSPQPSTSPNDENQQSPLNKHQSKMSSKSSLTTLKDIDDIKGSTLEIIENESPDVSPSANTNFQSDLSSDSSSPKHSNNYNILSTKSSNSTNSTNSSMSNTSSNPIKNNNNNNKIDFKSIIKKGYNPNVKCMRLTIDPVIYSHRPLLLYGALGICEIYARICLKVLGYSLFKINNISYWYRKAKSTNNNNNNSISNSTKQPLVFIHGIGIGLASYIPFVRELHYDSKNNQERDVLLILLPYVSMKIESYVPSVVETVSTIELILSTHNYETAIFIGHSYGSLICSWCIKSIPERLHHVILIDPVCFMLFEHDLSYNFLYRQPFTATQWVIHWFAARELFIAHTLSRHFWWHLNVLWCEDCINIGCEKIKIDKSTNQKSITHKTSQEIQSQPIPLIGSTNNKKPNSNQSNIKPSPQKQSDSKLNKSLQLQLPNVDSSSNESNSSSSTNTYEYRPRLSGKSNPLCYVFLSECDDIVSSRTVANYLKRTVARLSSKDPSRYNDLIKVTTFPGFKHAQFVMRKNARQQVLDSI